MTRSFPSNLPSLLVRRSRERLGQGRDRREHDDAIAADPRFASEHRIQVGRSIDLGRGGCPFCD
jgi:hypothetical protein